MLERVEPPEAAITLPEAKVHLRVSHGDEDILILELIEAATAYLDGWRGVLGRALMPQVWEMRLEAFPAAPIRMPFGPVTAVAGVAYRDTGGAERVCDPAQYRASVDAEGAWLMPAPGGAWPATLDSDGAVRVRWAVGSGADAADRAVILRLVASAYLHREAGGDIAAAFSEGLRGLAFSRRVWSF